MKLKTTAYVGLLDENQQSTTTLDPCEISWEIDQDGWRIDFRSHHHFDISGVGAKSVGVFIGSEIDPELWWVLPLVQAGEANQTLELGRQ